MKIISIDPGYERLGLAIIEKEKGGKETLIFSECFKTSAKLPHHERLTLIGGRINEVIKKYKPEQLATEKLFFAGNQKTALLVSEARGVILYTGSSLGLEIFEYRPNEIKIAITGYGSAEKKQIMDMTRKLIKIDSKTNSDDELDAIAIGLTHLDTHRN
ncbi:MAG: crossover junction endodeoxyribonuclease RuvC [Parcubacteria bacterium C7867-003]|nr:MAG: crossover junction endodeoxyribonuclease RuvC [Parcubacteria bacterium C7867-003]